MRQRRAFSFVEVLAAMTLLLIGILPLLLFYVDQRGGATGAGLIAARTGQDITQLAECARKKLERDAEELKDNFDSIPTGTTGPTAGTDVSAECLSFRNLYYYRKVSDAAADGGFNDGTQSRVKVLEIWTWIEQGAASFPPDAYERQVHLALKVKRRP